MENTPLKEIYEKIQDMRDAEREILHNTIEVEQPERLISYQRGRVIAMDDVLTMLYPIVSENQQ